MGAAVLPLLTMAQNRLLATCNMGFAGSIPGGVARALVDVLPAFGVSGRMGWLDDIFMPAVAW
jgi:hypothetical protein